MIVDKWFRKVKLLNKMKELVMLVAVVMVTKVVEEGSRSVDKVKEKVIDYAFIVIEKEKQIADSES